MNIIRILFSLICFSCFGQEFKVSKDFLLTKPNVQIDSTYIMTPFDQRKDIIISLVRSNDTINKIHSFKLGEIEFYDGYVISILENPKIKDIETVVKVQIDYFACCVHTEDTYLLETKEHDWVALPVLQNNYCDGPEPFYEYRFSSQKFGETDTILETHSFPNQNFAVDSVKVLKRFNWNGKSYLLEKD